MRVLFRSDHGARFQFRTARAFADSTKRVGERLTVQGRGRQFGYELAGFGKTVRGSFPCEADLTDGRAVRIGAFGSVKEHLDARKSLGHGVVNLGGESFTFREFSGIARRRRQFFTSIHQLVDETTALGCRAVQSLISETDNNGFDADAEKRKTACRETKGT